MKKIIFSICLCLVQFQTSFSDTGIPWESVKSRIIFTNLNKYEEYIFFIGYCNKDKENIKEEKKVFTEDKAKENYYDGFLLETIKHSDTVIMKNLWYNFNPQQFRNKTCPCGYYLYAIRKSDINLNDISDSAKIDNSKFKANYIFKKYNMMIPSDTIFTQMAYGGDCLYDYNLIYKVDSISTGKVNIHLELLECVKHDNEGFLKKEN